MLSIKPTEEYRPSGNYDPYKWTDKQQPKVVQPAVYQVKTTEGWVEADRAVEIEGGCLRYFTDGFAMTAPAGGWRITAEDARRIGQIALDVQQEAVNKAKKIQVFLGICVLLFIIVSILEML